jgi:alpha-glucosidase
MSHAAASSTKRFHTIYQVFVQSFAGGSLRAIGERLPHVAGLADALYLTPFFAAPSEHRYDTADFDRVDPRLGGEAELEALVGAARAQGLGLFFDIVLNHVGAEHRWVRDASFARFLRGTPWRGHGHLHELAYEAPALREALLGRDGVVAHTIARGADGLRVDCANDLGPAFCRELCLAVARAGGRAGAIGEVMSWPGGFLADGALDGVMGYWPRAAFSSALEDEAQVSAAGAALDRLAAVAPLEALLRSWTVLSSHDTPRLSDQVGFDEQKARLLLALQFAYPGTPLLYYGEEVGMTGGPDPGCRAPMIWDPARWDEGRLAFVRRLVELRRALPALHDGAYLSLAPPAPLLAWARVTDDPRDALVCVANLSPRPVTRRLLLPIDGYYDALPLGDCFGGDRVSVESGGISLRLAPYEVRWLMGRDDDPSGYRFWKARPLVG